MANFMDSILVKKPGMSRFPLTHEQKMSLKFGKIVPHLVSEVVPGDVWRVSSEIELKFSPLISPVMHRINLFQNYFYVPWLQIWSPYEDFISGGRKGDLDIKQPFLTVEALIRICIEIGYRTSSYEDPSDYVAAVDGFHNSFFDYCGLPVQIIDSAFNGDPDNYEVEVSQNIELNMLPIMACVKAWHDYFQDENLDDSFELYDDFFNIRKEDWISEPDIMARLSAVGFKISDIYDFFTLKNRAWEHDYFTSALPFAQRGETVQVPLAGNAPVSIPVQEIELDLTNLGIKFPKISYSGGSLPEGATHWDIVDDSVGSSSRYGNFRVSPGVGSEDNIEVLIVARDDNNVAVGSQKWAKLNEIYENPDLVDAHKLYGRLSEAIEGQADLSNASAVSINTFRWLERLQSFLEKNARSGWRYFEQLLCHWHVIGDDKTLHRAEYLSGSVQPVKIGEVLQTSESTEQSPQAEFAGYAASYGNMNGFKRRFKYHGYVIGFVSVLPRTNYMQGIPRMFLKSSKYDYLFPEFAHLGEQPVYNAEVYYHAQGTGGKRPFDTFGYMPRYSEYRTTPSQVHGDFQDTLDFWHLARKFETAPSLNKDFIYANPSERIFAVVDHNDRMWCQILNKISVLRTLPKYGTPSL